MSFWAQNRTKVLIGLGAVILFYALIAAVVILHGQTKLAPGQAPAIQGWQQSSLAFFDNSKEVLRITPKGEFIFAEGVTPSDAAKVFIKLTRQFWPCPSAPATSRPTVEPKQ